VTKLNSSGNALVYSTYLGGSENDYGYGIAVDGDGCAYVTGVTWSSDFPTHSPYQGSLGGNADPFVTKLDADGEALGYSIYLGGNDLLDPDAEYDEAGKGIAVDNNGWVYVTGTTCSSDFPTHSPYQESHGGWYNCFITKLPAFLPFISGVTPDYGPPEGGNEVTITGGYLAEGMTVTFGGIPATNVQVSEPNSISAVVPAFDIGSEEHVIVEVAVDVYGLTGNLDGYAYTTLSDAPGTGTLTVSFRTGLNVVSLPLQPETPFTAKTFAEHIGDVTLILHHDNVAQEFSAYLPAHDTHDGFPIQGGEGYIVNVTADKDVDFTGGLWDNLAPRKDDSLSTSNGTTWAFVATGELPTELGEDLIITARNVGRDLPCKVLPSTGRKFLLMFVDLSQNPVVAAGEQIEVTFADRGSGVSQYRQRNILSEGTLTVKSEDIDKAFVVIKPSDISLWTKTMLPDRTELLQNYPNPFNPETWIPFQLSEPANVTISIYDISGKLVRTLVPGPLPAGTYLGKDQASYWNGKNQAGEEASSGIYFYRINAGSFNAVRRMVLLK